MFHHSNHPIVRPFWKLELQADFLSWQKSLTYSLRIFVDNFSLLSPLQRVLAARLKIFNEFVIRSKWQYKDSGSSTFSKWQYDRLVAVVTHCWLLVHGNKRLQRKMTKNYHCICVEENIGIFSKS